MAIIWALETKLVEDKTDTKEYVFPDFGIHAIALLHNSSELWGGTCGQFSDEEPRKICVK